MVLLCDRRQPDSLHEQAEDSSISSDSASNFKTYPKTLEPHSSDLCMSYCKQIAYCSDYCSFRLPPGIPPSFRGTAIRYNYTVIVAAQAKGGHLVSTCVPIRVLSPNNSIIWFFHNCLSLQ